MTKGYKQTEHFSCALIVPYLKQTLKEKPTIWSILFLILLPKREDIEIYKGNIEKTTLELLLCI